MPYDITWEEKGVLRRYFGHLSGAELIRAVVEVEADPRFDSIRYVLNDFLDVDSIAVSDEDIMEISALDGAAQLSNPRIRVAVVTQDEDMRRHTESYAASGLHGYPTRVFTNQVQARAWLMTPFELG